MLNYAHKWNKNVFWKYYLNISPFFQHLFTQCVTVVHRHYCHNQNQLAKYQLLDQQGFINPTRLSVDSTLSLQFTICQNIYLQYLVQICIKSTAVVKNLKILEIQMLCLIIEPKKAEPRIQTVTFVFSQSYFVCFRYKSLKWLSPQLIRDTVSISSFK